MQGFSPTVNLTTNGASILNANKKYKDIYQITTDGGNANYKNTINKKGNAIYETSIPSGGGNSWYSNFSITPHSANP